MIVQIGSDNVVKNILVGEEVDDWMIEENPDDTFSIAPVSNLVAVSYTHLTLPTKA